MNARLLGQSLLLALAIGGCSSYRVVRVTRTGGEVALQGAPDGAREKAAGYMAARCSGAYEILEEGEAVVGTDTDVSSARVGRVFGVPVTTTSATTTDKREWRIKYQCRDADEVRGSADDPGAPRRPRQGRVEQLVVRF